MKRAKGISSTAIPFLYDTSRKIACNSRQIRTPPDFRATNSETSRDKADEPRGKQKGKISLTFECEIQGCQAENPLARSVSGRREKIRCRSRGNTPLPRSTRTWKLVGSSSNIDDASSDRALEVVISGNGTSCNEPSPTLTRFPDHRSAPR